MDVKHLCKALRSFDERNVDLILSEALDESGLGLAVMNRLKKSRNPLLGRLWYNNGNTKEV